MWSEDLRQWHYLRTLKGQRVPTQWVLLDYHTVPDETPDPSKPHALRLHSVVMRRCTLLLERLVGDEQYNLSSGDDMLFALLEYCTRPGCVWVIGHRVAALLELIDWWGESERGGVRRRPLTGHCHDSQPGEDSGDFVGDAPGATQDPGSCPCRQHCLESPYRQLVTSDPPFICSCYWHGNSITIVDSRNYWPETPAEMAKEHRIALPHLGNGQAGDELIFEHLNSRLDALQQQLGRTLGWWQSEAKATWSSTTPGLAWGLWRRHHLEEQSVLVHGDRLALQLERLSLYGGDCRPNYVGKVINESCHDLPPPRSDTLPVLTLPSAIASVDVRSLYPSLVSSMWLPSKLIAGRIGDRRIMDLQQTGLYSGVAFVRVRAEQPVYPCRCHRDTHVPLLSPHSDPYSVSPHCDHVVLYPVGTFDTVLCGADLLAALAYGHVERVYYWCQYEVWPVAQTYMRWLHDERIRCEDDGLDFQARLCKLLANALIGRWAAWSRRWEDVPGAIPVQRAGSWTTVNADTGEIRLRRALAGVVQEQRPHGEAENSLPVLAGHVTAAGRQAMNLLRHLIGQRNWYYQDTDGLLMDSYHVQPGWTASAAHIPAMGEPQLREVDTRCTVLGKRCYWYLGEWVLSGARHAGWDSLREEWVSEVIDGAATLIHRGSGLGVRTRQMTRHPRRTESGGRVGADGWVEPWEIGPRER